MFQRGEERLEGLPTMRSLMHHVRQCNRRNGRILRFGDLFQDLGDSFMVWAARQLPAFPCCLLALLFRFEVAATQ